MRKFLLLALMLVSPLTLQAQPPTSLRIAQVRVGFPPTVHPRTAFPDGIFKAGAFVPVFVDVAAGPQGWQGEAALQLAVETPDNDGDITVNTIPVTIPALGPNQAVTVQTFTRPAGTHSPVTVRLRSSDGAINDSMQLQVAGRAGGEALYLLIGSDLPGLRSALAGRPAVEEDTAIDGGPESIAVADSVAELPDQWFAYEGVDLVILTTAKRDFLLELAGDARRRGALAQWVRRGGRLVVSAARNQDLVAGLVEIEALLPVRFAGVAQHPSLNLAGLAPQAALLTGPVASARLEPKADRTIHPLIGEPLLIVQGTAGLGRVTVVGIDIDQGPFTGWAGSNEFLRGLLDQAYPRSVMLATQPRGYGSRGRQLMTQLDHHLQQFDEVPVISFGWVALFIVLYILLVGPLEYWVLNYVVKRPELTWITFPTLVILVSVLAYFTAYQLKGRELRLRKVDLVDIDLRDRQAYGRTWLTIFSPRIENYTIGLQPVAGGRQRAGGSSVVMSWLSRPAHEGGPGSQRTQSLFPRSYDYAPDAAGLERVPIPVWATKSFTAAWSQTLADDPLLTAELHAGPDGRLTGSITWRPGSGDPSLNLDDAHLIYQGHIYPLPLPAGQAVPVNLQARVGGRAVVDWLPRPGDVSQFMRSILFFESTGGGDRIGRNHGLRDLDQSWRLNHDPREAVLLASLPIRQGPAADVNLDPATPTRLWLGSLPVANQSLPPLTGTLLQETWVRVYIPVQEEK